MRILIYAAINKLILVPILVMCFIAITNYCGNDQLFAKLLILEATAPPAIGLFIQVKNFGGDYEFVSSGLLVSYIGSIITIPLFFSLWNIL